MQARRWDTPPPPSNAHLGTPPLQGGHWPPCTPTSVPTSSRQWDRSRSCQGGRPPQAGCRQDVVLAPTPPSSPGCSWGAAPTQGLGCHPPPRAAPSTHKEPERAADGAVARVASLGAAPTTTSPVGAGAPPVSLPSLPKRPTGDGRQPGGHVEALRHHHTAPGLMAPAARPVGGLIKDALIFQAGTSNPGSVVSSMDLITDAGLIGQFPREACNKAPRVEGAGRG